MLPGKHVAWGVKVLEVKNPFLSGIAVYEGWSYSDNSSKFRKQPYPLSYAFALDENVMGNVYNPYAQVHRIFQYADLSSMFVKTNWRIQNTSTEKAQVLRTVISALHLNRPVLAGILVDNSFLENVPFIPMPNMATFNPIGGTAIAIVGYGPYNGNSPTTMYFKFINSWGASWGDRGFGYLPAEYLCNVNIFQEELYAIWFDKMQKGLAGGPAVLDDFDDGGAAYEEPANVHY